MTATNCTHCEALTRPGFEGPEVCGHPERETDPRDDRTGWEREHDVAACPCGRAVVVRGLCAYCLHAEKLMARCYRCENGQPCRDCGVLS